MQIQAEANLSALIESSEALIWSVDLEDCLVTFNSALRRYFETTFGIHPKLGMTPRDLIPSERVIMIRSLFQRARTEGSIRVEYSLADNRTLDLALSPIFVDGKLTGVSIIGKDITAQKATERALQEAERKYREIFDKALEGMFQTSCKGKLLTANPALAKMLGYDSAEDLLSVADDVALVIWEDPDERSMYMHQIQQQGSCMGFECRLKRKDGSVILASLNSRQICGDDGQPIAYEGFLLDITERKRAEQVQRDGLDTLRETELVGALGSYILDIPFGTWTSSDALDEFFGIGKEYVRDVAGWIALIHPDDRDLMTAYFAEEVLGKTQAFDKEYRILRQTDGSVHWVHGLGRLEFDAQGIPLRMRGFIKDITEHRRAETQLRDSEERYRVAFQTSLDCVNINRLDNGAYVDFNQAFVELIGYTREEMIGRSSVELGIWADPRDRLRLIEALRLTPNIQNMEAQFKKKDGTLLWGLMSASLIALNGVPCVLSVTRNVTEAKAAEQRLAATTEALLASEERYRTVFHTSLDCITLTQLNDGRFIDVNKAFLDLIGIESDQILGKTSTELGIWAQPKARAEFVEMLRRSSTFRDFQTEFVKKCGEKFWVLISAAVIEMSGIPCIVTVIRDISGVKAAESKIHTLALYDPLTGLPNRRMVFESLSQTLADGARKGQRKALLLVDVDNLKTLNDTLGHHTGDLLLQEVARRIAACAHEADTVGRLGGDEFVVILDNLSEVAEEAATQAKAAAEQILTSIRRPCLLEDREYHTAASMGITVFGNRDKSADRILQKADIALHLAKAEGRNTLRFFSPALQAVVNAHATLEKELRCAIKEKQFVLYYQPQIERGRMTGAEALIRWKHPSRGIVSPDEFIPMAEESRLILPMGDWVLESACEQLALWAGRNETAHLTLAVNISALQFRQPEFVEHVLAALDRTQANPKYLKFELTESMLVENFEEVIAKMAQLKAHGLSFSLDDFGTGYSSLAYLKRLPLDQLKIDRAFVRDMMVDLTSGAIAQTIISLGRAMDLSVIAEGVETEEQRGFLAGLGCHCFQGFLFSRPIPLDEFQTLL